MSPDKAKPGVAAKVQLPVTERMEQMTRLAVYGDAGRGIASRIGFNELCRQSGLAKMQLLRTMNRDGKETPMRMQEGLTNLCRALGAPEYYALPISDSQVAMLDALREVSDAGGDLGHFVAQVQLLARLEAANGREQRSSTTVARPASTPRPAFVRAHSSSDEHKK